MSNYRELVLKTTQIHGILHFEIKKDGYYQGYFINIFWVEKYNAWGVDAYPMNVTVKQGAQVFTSY